VGRKERGLKDDSFNATLTEKRRRAIDHRQAAAIRVLYRGIRSPVNSLPAHTGGQNPSENRKARQNRREKAEESKT